MAACLGSQPLRVVHVVWGGGFGGIERLVSDLARAQATAGPAEIGVMVCGAPAGDPSLAAYASPGVTVSGGGLSSGFDVSPIRLRAIARELATYDVIHLHGFTPVVALTVGQAMRPVVFTEHGLLGLGERWPSRAAVKQSAKGLFLRRTQSTVACVSEWVAETARKKYRLSPDLVHHVPDGVDFARIRAMRARPEVLRDEGVHPSDWVMVVTARFVFFKRIDRLLEAAAALPKGGREWTLLLVGSGPEEDALRRQAAVLGIADRVRFLGYRDNVWDLVAAADLVPVPSGYEAFGLVVVEAMALDRPVVAFSDSGGPAEILRTVGGGLVVDTVEQLTSVLEQSRGEQATMSLLPLDRGRLREAYSIDTVVTTYQKLYESASEGAPGLPQMRRRLG
jgi:glycosyltransferase involved in cell wall biosynthesis